MRKRVGDINYEKAMEFLKRGDVKGAMRAAERASEFDHPRANELLMMTQHLLRLEDLLKRADRDDPDALYELAVIHIVGLGLEGRQLQEGIEFATKAWDRGRHEKAGGIVTLADDSLSTSDQTMALLRYLSEQGAPEAQLELASILFSGNGGDFNVPVDADEGIRLLKMAVAQNYRPAKLALEQLLKQMGDAPAEGKPAGAGAAGGSSDDDDDGGDEGVDMTGAIEGEDLDKVD